MLGGSFLKGIITVGIMIEQCISLGPSQAFPTMVYNAWVLLGVALKVDIRRGAPEEKKVTCAAILSSSIQKAAYTPYSWHVRCWISHVSSPHLCSIYDLVVLSNIMDTSILILTR